MTGLAGEVVERGAEEEVTERTGLLGRIGGEEGEGKKINLLGIFPALGVGVSLLGLSFRGCWGGDGWRRLCLRRKGGGRKRM